MSENTSSSPRHAQVPDSAAGRRFDAVLAELFPEFSRSRLTEWIKSGAVLLDGEPVRPRDPVRGGEIATLNAVLEVEVHALPEDIPLSVLYEDEHVFVIDKPAGLVVHPGAGNPSGTLLNALLFRDPEIAKVPRAGVVHRLDKDTSGLMVVAKSRQVMDALVAMIARRDVSRQYVALAHGAWRGGMREVRQAIGRDPRNRLRMAVVDLGSQAGKPAQTDITGVDSAEQACLVHCKLHTGRTHQIRVHMAWLGHPLLADALYGGTPLAGMERQALHAYRLGFVHPITGQEVLVRSTPPADFMAAIDFLGLRYNPPH